MVSLIFVVIYLIPILVIWGLVILIIKFPIQTLSTFTIFSILMFLGYKSLTNQHYLSFVPDEMGVKKILYLEDQSWGFGPGGNETGLVEFELPDNVAEEIIKGEVDYFNKLNNNPLHGSNDCYGKWYQTPIPLSDIWQGPRYSQNEPVSKITSLSIENYLDRYGFSLHIDSQISATIDNEISKTGSYYEYCPGGGVLIVMPKVRKVVFAYAG